MDSHSTELLIRDIAIIIVAATVSMRIFSMLKLPQLLGFIIVGILLSPVTGIVGSSENIAALGELGVMFMMFSSEWNSISNASKRCLCPVFWA